MLTTYTEAIGMMEGSKKVSSLSGCAASLALDNWAVHVPVDLVHLSLERGRERTTGNPWSERGAWDGTAPSVTLFAEYPIKRMVSCQTKCLAKVRFARKFLCEILT